jgi:hypothetical protein
MLAEQREGNLYLGGNKISKGKSGRAKQRRSGAEQSNGMAKQGADEQWQGEALRSNGKAQY